MDLFDTLSSYGLTIKVLQILIVVAIAIFIIGMYWRQIVIGAGIIFCFVVFVMPAKSVALAENAVAKVEDKVEAIHPADVAPTEFIDDCIRLNAGATKASCEKLWKEKDE